ncbi:MAG: alpha/beta hydrolase [Oceanipulchritudo sp.]
MMPGPSTFSLLKLVAVLLVLGYLGLALFAALFANRLLFPAPPSGYSDSPEILKFRYGESGTAVSMLFLANPGSPYLVFYHHGNGEDLQSVLPRLQGLREAGFAVLAWDYPGYGTSEGRPSESLVLEIAGRIRDAIPEITGYPKDRTLLYGRSLGGGPAIWLASREEAAGLILEGVFTSVFRVGLGINILPWDLFDNIKRIRSIRCPVLVMHGTRDGTVPFRHGVRLLEAAPEPKFFTWFDGGKHNDLIEAYPDAYYSSIRKFVEFMEDR